MHRTTRRRLAPILLFTAGSLILGACSSSSKSADTTVAAGADTTAAPGVETTAVGAIDTTVAGAATTVAGAADTTVAGAAETTLAAATGNTGGADRVAAFRTALTALPFSEPISAVPKAKKVYYVQCSVSACTEIKVGIEAAAKALGWTFESSVHKDTPDTVAAAFDAAIAAKPDVVLTSGNPREWFAPQLKTLADAKIPVVAWSLPEGYEPGNGISANLLTNDDYYFYGVLMADWVATTTKTKHVMFVGLPTFPVLSTVQTGFKEEIARVCPDCKVETFEVAVTDLGTNLPGQMVSKLQADKQLDTVAYAFGGMLFGVPDALKAADLLAQSTAISQAGGPMNFAFINNGEHQAAEVGLASELLGWRALDVAARLLSGGTAGKSTPPTAASVDGHPDILVNGLPLQILQKGDIKDATALWPGVEGFQAQFKKLWGV